jgi:molybdate transport system substrate-binding protein
MSVRSFIAISLLSAAVAHGKPLDTPLKVAAASDLALAFKDVGAAFEARSGQKLVYSFGSTGLLAKQIQEGAPFDVFAAANISFAEDVIKAGACAADSKQLYARGRIVVWTPKTNLNPPKTLQELADKRYVKIAIANPDHAPYGKAAVQAFTKAGIYETIRPRLVFGENVLQAHQFAKSGNVEASVIALSLSIVSDGNALTIDDSLHAPIDQAMVACGKSADRLAVARQFTAFVNSAEGRTIMKKFGFLLPGEVTARTP